MSDHDTREAVEAMADAVDGYGELRPATTTGAMLIEAAAMLLRLLARAEAAEQHLEDQARRGNELFLRFQAERDAANRRAAEAAAAALNNHDRKRMDAERERDGANALVERMHAQDVLAIRAWQEAHPDNELVWPDQMRLTAWCMGEVAKLTAERDAARAAGRAEGLRDAAAHAATRAGHPLITGYHKDELRLEGVLAARDAILALIPEQKEPGA